MYIRDHLVFGNTYVVQRHSDFGAVMFKPNNVFLKDGV